MDILGWIRKNNKKAAVVALAIFLAFFIWGVKKANAAEVTLGLAAGYNHTVGARYEEIMLLPTDHWYGSITRIGGDNKHDYQYNRYCGGYKVFWRQHKGISPIMRLGACWFDEQPEDYISDKFAYDIALGVRLWDVVEVEFDQHNSTAGRSDQNEGLDAFMLRVVFPLN
jgi:hypothetical protein